MKMIHNVCAYYNPKFEVVSLIRHIAAFHSYFRFRRVRPYEAIQLVKFMKSDAV